MFNYYFLFHLYVYFQEIVKALRYIIDVPKARTKLFDSDSCYSKWEVVNNTKQFLKKIILLYAIQKLFNTINYNNIQFYRYD